MDAWKEKFESYQERLQAASGKPSAFAELIEELTEEPWDKRSEALFDMVNEGDVQGEEMLFFLMEAARWPHNADADWERPDPYADSLGKLEQQLSDLIREEEEGRALYDAYYDTVRHFLPQDELYVRKLLMQKLVEVAEIRDLITAKDAKSILKAIERVKVPKKKKTADPPGTTLATRAPAPPPAPVTALALMKARPRHGPTRPPPSSRPAPAPEPLTNMTEPQSQSGGVLARREPRQPLVTGGAAPPRSTGDHVVDGIIANEIRRRKESTRNLLRAYAELWKKLPSVGDLPSAVSMKKAMRLLAEKMREHLPYIMAIPGIEKYLTAGLGDKVYKAFEIGRATDEPADELGDYPILGAGGLPYDIFLKKKLEDVAKIAVLYMNGQQGDELGGGTLKGIYEGELGGTEDISDADPFSERLPIYMCMVLDIPLPAGLVANGGLPDDA
jgi:hypothetical protein